MLGKDLPDSSAWVPAEAAQVRISMVLSKDRLLLNVNEARQSDLACPVSMTTSRGFACPRKRGRRPLDKPLGTHFDELCRSEQRC